MGEACPISPVASPGTRDNPPDVNAGHQLQGGRISLTLIFSHFHWNDRQAFEQAILVASAQKIDLREVERWSAAEGENDKFREFKSAVLRRKSVG